VGRKKVSPRKDPIAKVLAKEGAKLYINDDGTKTVEWNDGVVCHYPNVGNIPTSR
jgi:hypothetical protein